MDYFSDKERGSKRRTTENITPAAWGGIVALINELIITGAFGNKYPERCPDGVGIIGTDERLFSLALSSEILDVEWPLQTERRKPAGHSWDTEPNIPDTLTVLDLIQFCYHTVAKPIPHSYHDFFGHSHLRFDEIEGKEEFLAKVNKIFERNGIAFTLNGDGSIKRIVSSVIQGFLSVHFHTGDSLLDKMIEEAQNKFLNPNPETRRDAVERLWDCWERLKSIENKNDKKVSINTLLDKASTNADVRAMLEEEARKLTDIGNSFHIRHTEITQIRISDGLVLDYLFHRLFSMIQFLILKR
jgi:hypothetical protein